MGRQFGIGLAAAALAFSTAVMGATGAGAASPARDAVEDCQEIADAGGLELLGLNMGECVNFAKGPSSDHSRNFEAAFCGLDGVQLALGVSNKGQCMKVFGAG